MAFGPMKGAPLSSLSVVCAVLPPAPMRTIRPAS
jgi:hypothetical protein